MPEPTQTGNPNFFKVFKGKYEITMLGDNTITTPTIMLSCTNDVIILGAITLTNYTAGTPFAILPVEVRPLKDWLYPIVGLNAGYALMRISQDGNMYLYSGYSTANLRTSGWSFNISTNFYD